MSSSRQLFASSPRKKVKKSDMAKKIVKQNILMLLVNSHVEECNNILSIKINLLMREYGE